MATPASATASGIRTSRPSVYLAGTEDTSLSQGLIKLAIHESVNGLYHCEARFGNWGPKGNDTDFLYFDRAKFDFGKAVQIKIDTDKIFDGRIFAMEAEFPEGEPYEFTVLLEDRLQDLRMTRRTRNFASVSDSDVMNRIASDYGLQPSISVSGPTYEVLTQVNQSDLAFLRERARSIDAEVWIDDRQLYVAPRSSRNSGTVQLNYGHELREVRVTADLAGQRSAVSVNGWDIAGKAALTYQAGEQVISNELAGDTSGISILKSAFGERNEALAHTVPLSALEAQAQAESVLRMTARRFVTARGIAEGNAKLRVGSYADLRGLGPLFTGKYYLTEVAQTFDSTAGYLTHFTGERPGIARAQ
jgi:phage protein D